MNRGSWAAAIAFGVMSLVAVPSSWSDSRGRPAQETPAPPATTTSTVTATRAASATVTLAPTSTDTPTAAASDTATPTLTPRYAYVHLDIRDARIAVCDGLAPFIGTVPPPLSGCVDVRPRSDVTPSAMGGEQYILFASDIVRYRVYRTAPGWCEPVVIVVTATPEPTFTPTPTSIPTATLEPTPTLIPTPDPSFLPITLLRRPTERPR